MIAPFATRENLVARFGEDEISKLEDFDNQGRSDAQVSADALRDASDEVVSYALARYSPALLETPPASLVRACCDIARFRLYKNRPTEQVTYLYESTIKWLVMVSSGKVVVTFGGQTPVAQADQLTSSAAPTAGITTAGAFGSAILDNMPSL